MNQIGGRFPGGGARRSIFGRAGLKRKIEDDFSPEKIMRSGQCFRVLRREDGAYRFITGREVLYLRPLGESAWEASCEEETWERVWAPYFDLGRDYRALRAAAAGKHPFIDEAMGLGEGLRLLRQDPWEMLVTFILSQRKSIPAISSAVETLASRYGALLETGEETVHAFPTPRELSAASEADLRACALGYRAPYVADAVRRVLEGSLDLEALASAGDAELTRALLSVRGVGAKVAACVSLFGYGRLGSVPVDVWIRRAIQEDCGGCEPFSAFGEAAGIMQQYVFFAMRSRGRKGKENRE